MNKRSGYVAVAIVVLGIAVLLFGGWFILSTKTSDPFAIITSDADTKTQQVTIKDPETKNTITIFETDGVKHSVPLKDIISGGPPKDGIPSIDNPQFYSIAEADKDLGDDEPGIAVSIDGIDRFYPFQVLVFHEIVNDTFNNKRILITYCPLCFSGIVFDPIVKGEPVTFGTSGKLWNSNLVMYDRKTDSLWSQVLGEAIVGEMAGTNLTVLPSDQLKYGVWKSLHPTGQVLSRVTGTLRSYGTDPYKQYYTNNDAIWFPIDNTDNRLGAKDFVLGIVIDGTAKAYYPPSIKKVGSLNDTVGGATIVVRYEKDIDGIRIFEKLPSGELVRINPFATFWFSWVAVHPGTELYK